MCDADLQFDCRIVTLGAIPAIAVTGDVDMNTAPELQRAMQQAGEAPGATCLIVDLTNVAFIDSEGVRVLLQARLSFPGGVALVGLRRVLLRMLSVVRADHLFLFADTPEQAAAILAATCPTEAA